MDHLGSYIFDFCFLLPVPSGSFSPVVLFILLFLIMPLSCSFRKLCFGLIFTPIGQDHFLELGVNTLLVISYCNSCLSEVVKFCLQWFAVQIPA